MLLVIDVGNTNTVIGVFRDDRLVADWRIRTERNTTADELSVLISNLFSNGRMEFKDIEATVISCVVPPVMPLYDAFCKKYLDHAPLWVDATSVAGMPILYGNPAEVGADRIVNAVAAYDKFRTALIVIDFGTATTFDAISDNGEYLGGAICPGVKIAAEALFQHASKLPRVELLTVPDSVIGKNTADSMKSGIIYGYAGLVDGMTRRMRAEMQGEIKVVATGGLAGLISRVSETIEAVEPSLTLDGLRIIAARLSGDDRHPRLKKASVD